MSWQLSRVGVAGVNWVVPYKRQIKPKYG